MTGTLQTSPTLLGGPTPSFLTATSSRFVTAHRAAGPGGRSVGVVVPDATRSCPPPPQLTAVHGALAGRVSLNYG